MINENLESARTPEDTQWENALKFAAIVEEITGEKIDLEELKHMDADQVIVVSTKTLEKIKAKSESDAAENRAA